VIHPGVVHRVGELTLHIHLGARIAVAVGGEGADVVHMGDARGGRVPLNENANREVSRHDGRDDAEGEGGREGLGPDPPRPQRPLRRLASVREVDGEGGRRSDDRAPHARPRDDRKRSKNEEAGEKSDRSEKRLRRTP
jgi:hypothetical protein